MILRHGRCTTNATLVMRRYVLLLFPLTLLNASASAQLLQRIGVQQGLAVSRLTFHYQPDVTNNIGNESGTLNGYSTRLYADLLSNRSFHLSPGIGFTQRGGTFIQRIIPEDGSIGRMATAGTLSYVSVDVSARFGHTFGCITPYAFAGPRLDVLLNASSDFLDFDQRHALSRTCTGLRYGGGMEVGRGNITGFAEWCGLWDATGITTDITLPVYDTTDGLVKDVSTHLSDRTYIISLGVAVRLCPHTAS